MTSFFFDLNPRPKTKNKEERSTGFEKSIRRGENKDEKIWKRREKVELEFCDREVNPQGMSVPPKKERRRGTAD